jgi:G3E family GTPase
LAQVSRAPLHIVLGAPRSGKSALIERLIGARAGWLGMVNAVHAGRRLETLRRLPAGCPCCTGRVALQVELTRALRETRPSRVLIELPDAEHAELLRRVLGAWPLAQHLSLGRAVELPHDSALEPEMLERD